MTIDPGSSTPTDATGGSADARPADAKPIAAGAPVDHELPDIHQLIAEHYESVYRYAFRLSGNVADAEDLVQQAFVIAHQKLDHVRQPGKARSWLFTVLRNTFLRSIEKPQPQLAATLQLDVDEIPDHTIDDDDIDQELLQQALDELPPEFRVVVVMYFFEQASYKEIAAALDLPVGTVMSRLSRAKGRLRHKLLASAQSSTPSIDREELAANENRPHGKGA